MIKYIVSFLISVVFLFAGANWQSVSVSGADGYRSVFSVTLSSTSTSCSTNVWNKINFNTKLYDTNNFYDTTNARYKPTLPGYYQINSTVSISGAGSGVSSVAIFKNGALFKAGTYSGGNSSFYNVNVSGVVYLNGATDYVEIYGQTSATNCTYYQHTNGDGLNSFFDGFYIRGN